MRHFRSPQDVGRALVEGSDPRLVTAALSLVLNLQEGFRPYGGWDPDEHGWVMLLEHSGDLENLDELRLGEPFERTPWEEVEYLPDLACFTATVIMTNDFGMSYVVPEAILSPAQRNALEEELRPPAPAH